MVTTVRAVDSREECHWSHACSLQAKMLGSNGILKCKILSGNAHRARPNSCNVNVLAGSISRKMRVRSASPHPTSPYFSSSNVGGAVVCVGEWVGVRVVRGRVRGIAKVRVRVRGWQQPREVCWQVFVCCEKQHACSYHHTSRELKRLPTKEQ
jgi:hypothetical protein